MDGRALNYFYADIFHEDFRVLQQRRQSREVSEAWQNVQLVVFSVEKFVRRNFFSALKSFKTLLEPIQDGNFNTRFDKISEIIQKEESFFIQWIFTISSGKQTYQKTFSMNTDCLIDSFMSLLFISDINDSFLKLLQKYPDENRLNQYKWTRNQMLQANLDSQIMKISLKQNQMIKSLKGEKNQKPEKNAYPCLFNWIFQILLQEKLENQQNESSVKEALEILICSQNIIKGTGLTKEDFESEEGRQIRNLEFEDFRILAKNQQKLQLKLLMLREELSLVGIDKETIIKYKKEYNSPYPSLKKLYKIQDEKQIYFWIVLMDAVLKELNFESSELKKSSLLGWILQNMNIGMELKMNILNLDMRRHYYKTIQEVQKILMTKLEKIKQAKSLNNKIGEENHLQKSPQEKLKRPSNTIDQDQLRESWQQLLYRLSTKKEPELLSYQNRVFLFGEFLNMLESSLVRFG